MRDNDTKRVAVYCRVSTDRQEREGLGLKAQELACREYADAQGLTVDERYLYREVFTGYEYRERPRLTELRQACRTGDIGGIIFYDPDRMSRRMAHLYILDEFFRDHDVEIHFATGNYDDTPEGRLMLALKGYFAEIEREKIRDRMLGGRKARLRAGKVAGAGADLYGYRKDRDAGTREIYEPEAVIVRRIYRWIIDGISLREVARRLNEDGVPTPSERKYTYTDKDWGTSWGISTIRRLVTNPAYAGHEFGWRRMIRPNGKGSMMRPREDWIALPDGVTPAIVSESDWELAQERMKDRALSAANSRNRRGKTKALLRGMLHCPVCQQSLYPEMKRGKLIYRCASRHTLGEPCGASQVPGEVMDGYIWALVDNAMQHPVVIVDAARRQLESGASTPLRDDLERCQRGLADIERQQERHLKRLREVDDSGVERLLLTDLERLDKDRRQLEEEAGSLTAHIDAEESAARHLQTLATYVENVAANMSGFDFDRKRETLEALGVAVYAQGNDTEDWDVRSVLPLDVLANGRSSVPSFQKES